MALQKAMNFKGVDLSYLRITRTVVDHNAKTTLVGVGAYASKETRTADPRNFVTEYTAILPGDDLTLAQQYEGLKQPKMVTTRDAKGVESQADLNPFSGATDC